METEVRSVCLNHTNNFQLRQHQRHSSQALHWFLFAAVSVPKKAWLRIKGTDEEFFLDCALGKNAIEKDAQLLLSGDGNEVHQSNQGELHHICSSSSEAPFLSQCPFPQDLTNKRSWTTSEGKVKCPFWRALGKWIERECPPIVQVRSIPQLLRLRSCIGQSSPRNYS